MGPKGSDGKLSECSWVNKLMKVGFKICFYLVKKLRLPKVEIQLSKLIQKAALLYENAKSMSNLIT